MNNAIELIFKTYNKVGAIIYGEIGFNIKISKKTIAKY